MCTTHVSLIVGAIALTASTVQAGTIRGYVVDLHGHRLAGVLVEAIHDVPTDQHPPQYPKVLGKTVTDSHGNFTLSGVSQEVNIIGAEFKRQAGDAPPSFVRSVRIVLRPLPARID